VGWALNPPGGEEYIPEGSESETYGVRQSKRGSG